MSEKTRKVSRIVGGASEYFGAFLGKAASIGTKIIGFTPGVTIESERALHRAMDSTDAESSRRGRATVRTSPPRRAAKEPPVSGDPSVATVEKLDGKLAGLRNELKKTQAKAQEIESRLGSQLDELLKEKGSLVAELERSKRETDESKAKESAIRARVAALESELAGMRDRLNARGGRSNPGGTRKRSVAAKTAALESELATAKEELAKAQKDIAKARKRAQRMRRQLTAEIESVRAQKQSPPSDPPETQNQPLRTNTENEAALQRQIADLKRELAAEREELTRIRKEAEKSTADLKAQLETLRAEKESLTSELQKAQDRAAQDGTDAHPALSARIDELESDLAAAAAELAGFRNEAERTESSAESQIKEPLGEQSGEGEEAPPQSASDTDASQAEPEQENQQADPPLRETEIQELPDVSPEDIRDGVFPGGETERITFTKFLSDLKKNKDIAARVDAAKGMAAIGHELSVRALAARLRPETCPQVRQECVKALAKLRMDAAIPPVEAALADEDPSVRLAAVWGLYHLSGAQSAPALKRMLSDENKGVRGRAATCIGWLGQTELAVELLPLLQDRSDSVRQAAAEAMGGLGDPQVVFALIEALDDSVESVRRSVLTAIENVTGKKMSKSFPKTKTALQRLIARWNDWWKAEQSKATVSQSSDPQPPA